MRSQQATLGKQLLNLNFQAFFSLYSLMDALRPPPFFFYSTRQLQKKNWKYYLYSKRTWTDILYDCECADNVPTVIKQLISNRINYTFVLPEAKRKPEVNQQK